LTIRVGSTPQFDISIPNSFQPGSGTPYLTTHWATVPSAGSYGGSYDVAGTGNANASYAFTGKKLTLYTPAGPNFGTATVYLDGHPSGVLDLSATANATKVAHVITASAAGAHTVRVRVNHHVGAHGAGVAIGVDAVRVDSGVVISAPAFVEAWGGGLLGATSAGGGGSASEKGATLTLAICSCKNQQKYAIQYRAATAGGIFRISAHGMAIADIDTYGTHIGGPDVVSHFTLNAAEAGSSIVITALGAKNAASAGTTVIITDIGVYAPPGGHI
jgi:hypothetical protein